MTKYQPRRKNMRLQGFDYRTAAYYFLTICTYQREWLFEADDLKEIVEITLVNMPDWPAFAHVEIGDFVIMPNHIHLILIFTDPSFATDDFKNESKRLSKSVGSAVATFKGEVTRRIRAMRREADLAV